jgi:SAM-dependent methyltransferase
MTGDAIRIPTTYGEVLADLVQFADLSREDVDFRLDMEFKVNGWNVVMDVETYGVTPHVFDDHMARLYRESDGFLFETLAFWTNPIRQNWTEQAFERIRLLAERLDRPASELAVLMLGDGAGNDSLYLASRGLTLDYFDWPGSKTYDFSRRRFEHYGLVPDRIRLLPAYEDAFARQYDVVLSFEVLEHLPDPLPTIRDIARMLSPHGVALISESFGQVLPNVPTHLSCNARYDGRTPFLFLREGLGLTWYSQYHPFKPMEFRKGVPVSFWSLLRDRQVRTPYLRSFLRRPG